MGVFLFSSWVTRLYLSIAIEVSGRLAGECAWTGRTDNAFQPAGATG